jgi:hypothetical protein
MVKADMLYQLNLRLQEIKQNPSIFGGVSVILLGDLMQIQPVRAKWIFQEPQSDTFKDSYNSQNLWEQFTVIELNKNHRQGADGQYADLLNRIRFGYQTSEDLATLNDRVTDTPPENCLHIYGTNAKVNHRNEEMLRLNNNESNVFMAQHFHPTIPNYKPKLKKGDQIGTSAFRNKLELKIDAKVMLIHNIDTADSLANGVMGQVKNFIRNSSNEITHILVDFFHLRFHRFLLPHGTCQSYRLLETVVRIVFEQL